MPKGTVRIEVIKDRLRLAWSWQGKRFWLSLELPDSLPNRKAAQIKARTIELDIASNNFDPTLAKYKPQKQESIPVTELFDRFCSWKQRNLCPKTFTKYQGTKKYVTEFFRNKTAIAVTDAVAEDFRDWLGANLGANLEPVTVRERIAMMQACWNWGIKKKLVAENPWTDVKVKVPPRQKPQPFTAAEIEAIVREFRSNGQISHYADYVEFKFGVGLRTGEAAALQWKHCSPDCSKIWIGESMDSEQTRKGDKRHRGRSITLTPMLQQLLLRRKKPETLSDDLIFTSIEGSSIDAKNFNNRYWKPTLAKLGIDYRRPYTTRHTLISHAIDKGMNPAELAQLTGHNVRTLYEHYVGTVRPPQLPEILPSVSFSDFDSQVDREESFE
ncbi:MAG: tyrosine-type recombinase/integrase [Oscillatoriaceae cyanobacterium Prado104]|nr:tyrosine-type recombinase/integrase [Oscillatoriaceae cyanobacterium Prado104]